MPFVQEVPPPAAAQGSGSRFSGCTVANAAAVPLYFHLLRHAARPDRLWGLAAWRELLLQVGHTVVLLPICTGVLTILQAS